MKMTAFSVSSLALFAALTMAQTGWSQEATATPEAAPAASHSMNFAAIDADSDGKVTLAEIEAYRAGKVAQMDTNGDGKLSSEELTAAQAKMQAGKSAKRVAKMITTYDKDGDGALSLAEMPSGRSPQKMFAKADKDGDGALSQAEVDAAMAGMGGHGGKKGEGKHGSKHGEGKKGDKGDAGFLGMFGDDEAAAN